MSHKNDHQIPLETTWKPRRLAGLYITSGIISCGKNFLAHPKGDGAKTQLLAKTLSIVFHRTMKAQHLQCNNGIPSAQANLEDPSKNRLWAEQNIPLNYSPL